MEFGDGVRNLKVASRKKYFLSKIQKRKRLEWGQRARGDSKCTPGVLLGLFSIKAEALWHQSVLCKLVTQLKYSSYFSKKTVGEGRSSD